jgi:hypothetical protein
MYFDFYKETFRPFFEKDWETLADCTCRSVALQVELFGIDASLTRASAINGRPGTVPEILDALQADTLVFPTDKEVPSTLDIQSEPFRYDEPEYRQNFEGFEPGVTGLDLLFNYGREAPRYLAHGEIASGSRN